MFINRYQILTSPGFLISLCFLLVNDFYLKAAFHNPLTGKLSDFAGLFCFSLFGIAAFPRFRRAVCLVVALSFVFWKSSYSQPLLDWWNQVGPIQFSRTPDVTDLIALAVIPFSYGYSGRRLSAKVSWKWAQATVAMIAIFAFTATSYSTTYDDYPNKYYFHGTKAELFKRINDLHLSYFDHPINLETGGSGKLVIEIPSTICFESFGAELDVNEVADQTVVSIRELGHRCPKRPGEREKLLAEFEKEFIGRLRTGTPQTKHYKSEVEVSFSPGPPAQ